MPNVIEDGRHGDDHGIECPDCGGKTFLCDDQGGGLMAYQCEDCEWTGQVQYEWSDPDEEEDFDPEFWAHLEEELS